MKLELDVTFDLNFSLSCGQIFRFRKQNDWWYGLSEENIFKIRQIDRCLEFEGVDVSFIKTFFGLNDDLTKIAHEINKDAYIASAIEQFEGLRLIRQNPWECLSSFICATYKNIAAIEQTLLKMSQKHGEPHCFEGQTFWLFPSAEKLAKVSVQSLEECGLGYRAKYVQATAKRVWEEQIDLEEFKQLPYVEAKRHLLEFLGVGLKVADCVLLFSLEKMEAFPVDIWIKRILLNHYTDHLPYDLVEHLKNHDSLSNGEYEKLGTFARNYFGPYAGYAQEYIYHYERSKKQVTHY
ncbi:MAG: 8-oxoguanine DNA glycosylase [Nitrososphaerota archaeon]|jgi:N-glycosylase/DNA lyase|uniref:DNA-3-methyladenine glycosylase family protein n=1 Tax=Candidatus Bathycorpusculum sp. TaxID=2994959 RepID=UPI002826C497|nr:8-oxoguanine DNA glycosylase [Candidatus Termiticorpusculum sp.]MCL2256935.1 8-oxoguanine DNA glycosylase [Candidatus Termiticorpusculum sp.]MCL2292942.1 8-oxoguanine DNA glycosylase [Candidatus Termiticorpusculum sp.]MDR0460268.1 8-oxoguanine DNA glycosylase [Nitrososphaerota archaeon]